LYLLPLPGEAESGKLQRDPLERLVFVPGNDKEMLKCYKFNQLNKIKLIQNMWILIIRNPKEDKQFVCKSL
jgi:hypothetical protein